jgi:hypothetical protein
MEGKDLIYKPSYRFVGGASSRNGRSDQSHAQKQSARMRQWERRKDLMDSISTVGTLHWTRRSPCPRANRAPGANEQDDLAKGDPCVAYMLRRPTAAASRNLVRRGPVLGSGGSIVKLKAQYADPFETFAVPTGSKHINRLLDFRKSYSSDCRDERQGDSPRGKVHNRMISDLYEMTVHGRKMWPIAGISAFALQDTASSYALFSLIAFGQNAAFSRQSGLEAIAYKVKAIQIINNRLTNPGDASDGTIMAVTLLWQLEVSGTVPGLVETELGSSPRLIAFQAHFDDFSRCKVHIDGLRQLIERRGSLENLAEELLWEIAWYVAEIPLPKWPF